MSDIVNGYRLSSRAAEAARGRGGQDTGPAIENAVSSAAIATADPGDVFEWFGGGQQAAGMTITPETAMRSTAVWRCVTLISGALMTQELGVYRLSPKGEFIREHGHPYDRFLNCEPNQEMTSAVFVENIAIQLLLRGNGYGLIRQARNGTITSIDFYFPARVLPYRSADRSIWYRFTNEDGTTEDHHASYVLHFKGPGLSVDGIRALSPISNHAQSVGINLATRDYEAGQFERGLMTNDYFQFAGEVSREQRAAFKEYLRKKAMGITNAHNPLLLEGGAEWKRVAVTAKDAQLLELLQYSVVDVCRIYGVPPNMAGETSGTSNWGTGVEQQSIGFDRWTILPHKVRIAGEWTRKLFPVVGARAPQYFVWWNDDFLLSGDSKAIAAYLRAALGGNQLPGWISKNEARRKVNLPPVPDGDAIYSPTGEAPAPEPTSTGDDALDDALPADDKDNPDAA
ncbi:phage portal protein [Sphingomonas dokdonensis]|uniref:Phage portal protein n=1 Tax=Sphingomonas dokdonensis TaxID=344880 RepID=A0A245ZD07_9SPHN|nr:phage portal protein [Sphingomonas dokdonensis]OWK27571.1 phage portal protein [Sphingomonas dokdonensis]